MSDPTQPPEPGIYKDIPEEEYHTWRAASKSQLWRIQDMPESITTCEQAIKWIDAPYDSYDLIVGRAFDDAVSRSGRFPKGYAAGPNKTPTSAAFVKAQAATDKMLLTLKDIEKVPNMVQSLLDHPIAGELLTSKGLPQLTVVWVDDRTKAICKARIDRVVAYKGITTHVDWKTARSCEWFNVDAAKLGYPLQAAQYRDACEHIDRLKDKVSGNRQFYFVAVEKEPIKALPEVHRVEVLQYTDHDLDAALRVRDSLLDDWNAIREGSWERSPAQVHTIKIPRKYEDQHGQREAQQQSQEA